MTYVVYRVFGSMEGAVRMGLFWVLLVFTSINLVTNSFSYQNQRRKLFYYQLYRPEHLVMAKLLFNFLKVLFAGFLLLFLQFILSDLPFKNLSLLAITFILSGISIVTVITLVSAISSYSQNQNSLAAVLSLPLLIPVLIIGMRVSLISERMFQDSEVNNYLFTLLGIDILLVTLTLLFIPFVWKS